MKKQDIIKIDRFLNPKKINSFIRMINKVIIAIDFLMPISRSKLEPDETFPKLYQSQNKPPTMVRNPVRGSSIFLDVPPDSPSLCTDLSSIPASRFRSYVQVKKIVIGNPRIIRAITNVTVHGGK